MDNFNKIFVAIPAFNEAKVIKKVIEGIQAEGFKNICIADDGSMDDTALIAKKAGAIVVSHSINRGKGAATMTAIQAAIKLGAEVIVTMDSDGQHDPKDLAKMVNPVKNGECEVVLSYRNFKKGEVPGIKIIANYIGNFVVWLFYGLWVKDSQSGMRAYSLKAANLIDATGNDYEYESEVIREIHKHNLKYQQVPIKVYYTKHSMTKGKKQGFLMGLKTLLRIIKETVF